MSLGSVIAVGEGEDVDAGCKSGIKIIRFAAPGSYFHPKRFQTNGLSMLETRRMIRRSRRIGRW